MANKKSLYEILQVPQDATYPEIRAAHDRQLQSLESRENALSRDDYTMQVRLLKVAWSTLSTPASRDAYDASLHTREQPDPTRTALLVTNPGPAAATGASAASLRAEALMMRADALAMRADALGLKADLLSTRPETLAGADSSKIWSRVQSSARTLLLTLGSLVALGMVLKVAFLLAAGRQGDEPAGAPGPVSDKVFLQEYYQTYGVRPASRAEAALMDAERQKNEEAKRAQRQAEEDRKSAAQAERNFEEESRRRSQQVSVELQYAEEKARQARAQEARERDEEKRRAAESERARIEADRARWQEVLRTPSNN
jgi:hypothetical protein